MGDKSDLVNDNEYRYEYDENILSLYSQLSKERRNTQSDCDSDGNSSPTKDLILDELSDNERLVLKSLALLGGITIEKEVFNSWLGGQYADTISRVVEKGLILKKESSQKTELSLQQEIGEAVIKKLKPDLHSCAWAKNLCETAANTLKKQAKILNRNKPGDYILLNELTSTRWIGLARLLSEVLDNLDYMINENISFCIAILSNVIEEDVDRIWRFEINIDSLLERCMVSPSFADISGESKFNAFCLQFIAMLDTLRDMHPGRDSIQRIDDKITQMIDCLTTAETILNELPTEAQELHAFRLCLPIINLICYDGTMSIRMFSNEESAVKLYYHIRNYTERITIPAEKTEEIAAKLKYSQALIDESIRVEVDEVIIRRFYRSIIGREDNYEEAIAGAESDSVFGVTHYDYEDYSEFMERIELDECYSKRLKNSGSLEEPRAILDEIIADQDLKPFQKETILFGMIFDLGFDPEIASYSHLHKIRETALQDGDEEKHNILGDNIDGNPSVEEYWRKMRRRSANIENQQMAKMYLEYLTPLMEQAEDPTASNANRCAIQAIMLACCMNDRDAILKNTDMYFRFAIMDFDYQYEYLRQHYESLKVLCASAKEAVALFVMRGIEYLEKEAARPQTPEKVLFPLYKTLEVLAECINDTEKIDHYKEKQQEVLGLGFRYNIKPRRVRKNGEPDNPIL